MELSSVSSLLEAHLVSLSFILSLPSLLCWLRVFCSNFAIVLFWSSHQCRLVVCIVVLVEILSDYQSQQTHLAFWVCCVVGAVIPCLLTLVINSKICVRLWFWLFGPLPTTLDLSFFLVYLLPWFSAHCLLLDYHIPIPSTTSIHDLVTLSLSPYGCRTLREPATGVSTLCAFKRSCVYTSFALTLLWDEPTPQHSFEPHPPTAA